MPGGLCRVAPTRDTSVVSNQHGGVSKDVWVLAVRAGARGRACWCRRDRPLPLTRGGEDVPGRVADNLFWLGRYAERAEARRARAARGAAPLLELDAAPYDAHLPALLRAVTR